MARKYPEPNRLDPLSETALNRRVWAAYLHAGYDRTRFAAAMGVQYSLVSHWDTGKHAMSLAHFMRAAELVGFTMDELAHGHTHGHTGTRVAQGPEGALSVDAIRALLLAVNATTEQISALGEHQESATGRLQPMTRSYVLAFIATYAARVESGKTHAQALKLAFAEAVNARAAIAAHDSGRRPLGANGASGPGGRKRAPTPARKRPARVVIAKPTNVN